MAQPESEIRRLRDLMPASGRMWVQIERISDRRTVITSPFPYPWVRDRPVRINFDLWRQISRPQRDLLLLRQVSWVTGVRWFEPNWLQGAAAVGAIATVLQATQGDAIGTVVAGGLTALAGAQIWQRNRSPEREVDADRAALRVAERRGYAELEAAQHLLAAITTVSQLEGRSGLSYDEALRCQNLRAIARLDPFPPVSPLGAAPMPPDPNSDWVADPIADPNSAPISDPNSDWVADSISDSTMASPPDLPGVASQAIDEDDLWDAPTRSPHR